jgi:hypothetical protein
MQQQQIRGLGTVQVREGLVHPEKQVLMKGIKRWQKFALEAQGKWQACFHSFCIVIGKTKLHVHDSYLMKFGDSIPLWTWLEIWQAS